MSSVEIYLGHEIDIRSEEAFLSKLSRDLENAGIDALIFGNFYASGSQLDFLVITDRFVCLVELKQYNNAIIGGVNGPWRILHPSGRETRPSDRNPYQQVLNAKYAISNRMNEFRKEGQAFYRDIQGVICIFPELHKNSDIDPLEYVRVLGYPEFLDFLRSCDTKPDWTLLSHERVSRIRLEISNLYTYSIRVEKLNAKETDTDCR